MRDRERYEQRIDTVVDGRWRVDALLGWGSTSAVYAATHRNGHRAALKILHKSLCGDAEVLERFSLEAGIANKIRHRSIVPINDDGTTEDGCSYLILDLLEGDTLEEIRAKKSGRIEIEDLAPIAEELMSALAAVHAAGIIHRDLKPQNVFLTTAGKLKLLDFGTARIFDRTIGSVSAAGIVKGTPAFMSPEQARGERDAIDVQSDVWSLGAMLFTLLSGEYVHPGRDAHARLLAAATQQARKLEDVAPSIDERVATVIDRALFQDKSERWPDVRSMRIAFRSAVVTAVPTMRDLKVFARTMEEADQDAESEEMVNGSVSVTDPSVDAYVPESAASAPGGIQTPIALTSRIPRAPSIRPPSLRAPSIRPPSLRTPSIQPPSQRAPSLRPLDRQSDFEVGVASTRDDLTPLKKRGIPFIALFTGAAAMAAVIVLVVFFKSGGDTSTGHSGASADLEPPAAESSATPNGLASDPGFTVIEAPDDPAAVAAAIERNKKKELPAWATAPMPPAADAGAKKEKEEVASEPANPQATTSTTTTTGAQSDAGAEPIATPDKPAKSSEAADASVVGESQPQPAQPEKAAADAAAQ